MSFFRIEGGRRLNGKIRISGSKNSSLLNGRRGIR